MFAELIRAIQCALGKLKLQRKMVGKWHAVISDDFVHVHGTLPNVAFDRG